MDNQVISKYSILLTDFVNLHIDDFFSAPSHEEKYGNNVTISYIPKHSDRDDPNYIVNKPYYIDFVNKFIDEIIYSEDFIFDTFGHFDDYDGKNLKLYEFDEDRLNRFNRKSLIDEVKLKIAFDLYKVFDDIKNDKSITSDFFMFLWGNMIELSFINRCKKCDAYLRIFIDFDKKTVCQTVTNTERCIYSSNIPKSVQVKLDIPSKKLVFLNSPYDFVKIEREDEYDASINSTLGCIKETKAYEEHNIGFFFVGNTLLYAFKKDDVILFANYDEEVDMKKEFDGFDIKGNVCMDLWWYTVLDYDLYLKLCSEKSIKPESIEHFVIDIEGSYVEIDHSLNAHKDGYYWGTHSRFKIKE